MFRVPEKYRLTKGPLSSSISDGNNGIFRIRSLKIKRTLMVIASDGDGWEHVSVSLHDRCPTWEEMCVIKNMFWDEDDFVVQLHPPKGDWINNHNYCLHLWRKAGNNDFCERPPNYMVGVSNG